jgi:hypothetical protein
VVEILPAPAGGRRAEFFSYLWFKEKLKPPIIGAVLEYFLEKFKG